MIREANKATIHLETRVATVDQPCKTCGGLSRYLQGGECIDCKEPMPVKKKRLDETARRRQIEKQIEEEKIDKYFL